MQRWEELLRLSEYSDHDLREEFERRRTDLKKLEALNAELKSRESDEAFDLQLEVVTALAALRKSENAIPRVDTIGRWFTAFLVRRGLQAPDGRPLHRYRMSDREYEDRQVDIPRGAPPAVAAPRGRRQQHRGVRRRQKLWINRRCG